MPMSSTSNRNSVGQGVATVGITDSISGMFSKPPTEKQRKGSLKAFFNVGDREQLHGMMGRRYYSARLPNLARNPYYAATYAYAANHYIPSYNLLRTSLSQKKRANIERLLQPIKGIWWGKGVSIVSDGWSNAERRPIINFMAVTESRPMFLRAVNAEGEVKRRHFIAGELEKVIKEAGPLNVVQVITNNAASCKAAGGIIDGKFPDIFWTLCVMHTFNLALKNICEAKNTETNEITYGECSWITKISDEVFQIKKFIMNHTMRLSMFNKHVNLKMLSIAKTRFASVIIMLKRFNTIKRGLQSMVLSDSWALYREDDVRKALPVKEKILDDLWWDKIDYILVFTEPIYEMLRVADTDKPRLHLVYDMWNTMIEKVKSIMRGRKSRMESQLSMTLSTKSCWTGGTRATRLFIA